MRIKVMGIMSGSSLDGMDLACCTLENDANGWRATIDAARTVPYPDTLRERLLYASTASGLELARLHRAVGIAIGEAAAALHAEQPVELLASHGHTVLHQPDEGLTLQIGCGAHIAQRSGVATVCDFRTKDMAYGGQGAPLVPLGEALLFPAHRSFINIGGISNIALHGAETVIGYDVCIGNQALDHLAAEAGLPYDADGALGRSGQVIPELLNALHALPFHRQTPPRSLGREWFEEQVRPLLDQRGWPLADRMRTVVEHIAQQLADALANSDSPVLVTGGGAHNGLLMERLGALASVPVEIPDRRTVDYKEALVFALLGALRMLGLPTSLASVTGARVTSVGGALYLPN